MMPFEHFLELTATEPELVANLTEVCRERILDVLRVLLSEPGIEYLWIGGSEWVTPPMASPRTYDRLVQDQERSLIDYAHAQRDLVVHVHCHGHVRHALARTIERGADYTEPVEPPPDGDITMSEAKAFAAGRITLGGNIECRLLCNGSPEDVRAAVDAAYSGGTHRLVLRPTEGPSPVMSAQEHQNWATMVDAWEDRG
jgi:uroporphyrinogen-III decarboxylase